jgi:hypothetical protein
MAWTRAAKAARCASSVICQSLKRRKTYGFSKDLAMHRAASCFVGFSYNFYWAVRT